MQPSSRAMIWYFWRMSRGKILLLCALSVAASLVVKGEAAGMPGASYAYPNLILQVFLITVFGGCLFMWGTASSFLPHPSLLTLPLGTSRYLTLFYGYVIAVVGTVACVASAIQLHFFGGRIQHAGPDLILGFWHLPALCVALACLIQSMFHLSGIRNEFRVIPMAIAAEVLAFMCVLDVLDIGRWDGRRFGLTVSVAMLFAWASSYNSLTTHRNGGQRGGIAALLEWLDLGRGRTRPFTSPGRALFWLGWRRCGRLFVQWAFGLTLIGLGTIAVFLLFEPISTRSSFDMAFFSAALIAVPVLMCGAAFLCHILLLMRGQQDLFGPGRAYFLTLPVRSTELTRGCALSMVLSVLLVAVSGLLCLTLAGSAMPGHVWLEFPMVIKFTPLYLLGIWFLLWFGLGITASYLAFLPVMLGATFFGVEMTEGYTLTTLAAAGAAASAYCLVRGIRLGLLRRVDLCLSAALCVPVLAAVAVYVDKLIVLGPRGFLVALLCFCALLPVALPFIGAPLLMNWIRHR